MKKSIISSIMVCALLTSFLPAQAVYKPNETVSSENDITVSGLVHSSGCNSSSGRSSEFEVSDTTTTRFYIENNADFDITIKLQKAKEHRWNNSNKWSDSNMNGETSVTVKANAHKLIESNGAAYSKGTYRFSATGSRGGNYDYLVTMREFDN